MSVFLEIIIALSCGIVLRNYISNSDNMGMFLSRGIINIGFPCIILLMPPIHDLTYQIFLFILVPWLWIFITFQCLKKLGKYFQWQYEVVFVITVLCSTGNTGYFGLPLTKQFFPVEFQFYAVLYDQLVTFFFVSLIIPLQIMFFKQTNINQSRVRFILKIFLFPPFIAFIYSVFISKYAPIPSILTPAISFIAASIIPIGMFGIGLQLNLKFDKTHVAPLLVGVGWKMVIMPISIFIMYSFFQIPTNQRDIGVFQALMPPSISGYFFIYSAGIAPKFATSLVIICIFVMMISVPIYILSIL
ncbi:MAG: AEC family transporter [Methylacidiphilales bacterium]|nr:AEC family transporter [Candidatus Methylacidiphilales bacterium]